MSLLGDARRLPTEEPVLEGSGGYVAYAVCQGDAVNGDHAPDCPWLSIPKIVAVLEMLDRHGLDFDEHEYQGGLVLGISSECCCFNEPVIHHDDCPRKMVPQI